jgi:hypothetical protein
VAAAQLAQPREHVVFDVVELLEAQVAKLEFHLRVDSRSATVSSLSSASTTYQFVEHEFEAVDEQRIDRNIACEFYAGSSFRRILTKLCGSRASERELVEPAMMSLILRSNACSWLRR